MTARWFLPLGVVLSLLPHTTSAIAADWYAAPTGTAAGAGTKDSPWDIDSALGGGQKIAPGDTLWLLGGAYKHPNRKPGQMGYTVRLAGAQDKPIHVRAARGQRVTIDGGITVNDPASWLWIWDLEILVSENLTKSRRFEEPGSHPKSYDRPHGGLNIYGGTGCKYINLVIHDNAQGVSFWSSATDSELYGCIIYDNGWDAPDRGHGHAIYTQNQKGTKTISDCIMTGGYAYTLHAYGSERAFVDNYHVEGNICYDGGQFLIGGGRPSRGIRVLNNYLYNVSMRLGYGAPYNEDCEVRHNVIAGGELNINKFKQVVSEDNLVLTRNAARPDRIQESAAKIEIRPNRYDPNRVHIAIFNWSRTPTVALDLGHLDNYLKSGDAYRLLNPRDVFGKPVVQRVYDGKPVAAPVNGEFAAFVLVKGKMKQP
jgi:hypothetical protein